MFRRLILRWPALEHVSLKDCWVDNESTAFNALRSCTAPLKTASFVGLHFMRSKEVAPCLADLPATVDTLEVVAEGDLFRFGSAHLTNTDQGTLDCIKRLRSVRLIDQHDVDGRRTKKCARGSFDGFVANLDQVVTLTTSPAALSNLARLADLKKLARLEIIVGRAAPEARVEPRELTALFFESSSLTHVVISDAVGSRWSRKERRQVEHAVKRNISPTWV